MENFICPICKSTHCGDDYVVVKRIVKSEYLKSSISGRHAVHTFQETYFYCKICPECGKKIMNTKLILKLFFFLICPLFFVFMTLHNSNNLSFENIFVTTLFMFFCINFFTFFICGITFNVLSKTTFYIDIDFAKKNNACYSIFDVYNIPENKIIGDI